MIKRIGVGTSLLLLGLSGVAFAATWDYTGWNGDTAREQRKLTVVKDNLIEIGDCKLRGHCDEGGPGPKVNSACAILLSIADGKGHCQPGQEKCTINLESEIILEGGLQAAAKLVCSRLEGGGTGQVDDAAAFCGDNPSGIFTTRGNVSGCAAVHGLDQP
jgi:hypothetical protein